MKKLIAISAMALVMTTCSMASTGAELKTSAVVTEPSYTNGLNWLVEETQRLTMLEEEAAKHSQLVENRLQLHNVVNQTKQYVGKTWYVFSGSTPSGWDCSGLVMWTYEKLGIELRHSATSQMKSGQIVKKPKFGDVVSFSYMGYSSAYHVGIYLSPDSMLHSGGQKGDRTEIRSISDFAGSYSKVTYTRLIETK
jgi:cell wall-associated NlpC family hydrolase